MRSVIFSQCRDRRMGVHGVTEFGSFDNRTCKRVLDLLDPGGQRLGQVVINSVVVVKLGVNNGTSSNQHSRSFPT